MAFRKLVGSYKDYNLSTHIIEDGYLAVDVDTGSLRIGDGVTAGGTEVGGGSANSLGDLSAIGSTMTAPSNADLELVTAGTGNIKLNDISIADNEISTNRSNDNLRLVANGTGAVVVEGLKIQGTNISTDDSGFIEISGNILPSANGEFTLGSASKRWQTLFVTSDTVDIGGATLKTDDDGKFEFTSLDGGVMEIGANGATFPEGSKIGDRAIPTNGTGANSNRPVQLVKVFVSDGSTTFSDTQLLAKTADLTMEFNATVEDVPVFSAGGFGMTMANGDAFATTIATAGRGITLFQF